MKIIAVEISVNYETDEAVPPDAPDPIEETFTLAVTKQIAHDAPAAEHIPALTAELLRRYQKLNARKTN